MGTDREDSRDFTLLSGDLDQRLSREWLITNTLGGYASSTVLNCHTRRYHGLLVAAALPPLGRVVTLSNCVERLLVEGKEYQFSNFEFNGAIHPEGFRYQTSFHRQIEEDLQSVNFVYQVDDITFIRSLWLFGDSNTALIYWLAADARQDRLLQFFAHPMVALRDFHSLRRQGVGKMFETWSEGETLAIRPATPWTIRGLEHITLYLTPTGLKGPATVPFRDAGDWWYNFRYRVEAERGQDCGEDLFTPGYYELAGRGNLGFGLWIDTHGHKAKTLAKYLERVNYYLSAGQGPLTVVDEVCSPYAPAILSDTRNPLREAPEQTLRKAARQFVVSRRPPKGKSGWSIIAGFPWFGDWGRDAFIALPGLLLDTGRYEEAREVLRIFASAQADGMIPNCFDDYGGEPAYNSVDASLWFIVAADEYLRDTGDEESWKRFLAKAWRNVLDAYATGTRFDIHADPADGLLWAGSAQTQLTWMDARCGDVTFTPRWGKAVEVNALWYCALRAAAERFAVGPQRKLANQYRQLADRVRESFRTKFWHSRGGYLYDVVRDDFADPAIRPNQVFAVSLRHSPLREDQQRAVMDCVQRHLLTPFGLRSLSPSDPAYRPRYVGDQFQRDGAYHQGTVWAYLIGPFIEGYLRVRQYSTAAGLTAQDFLKPLYRHLYDAGIGSISEIFDGDPPHTPRGCFAQAWSVASVIHAQMAINRCLAPAQPCPSSPRPRNPGVPSATNA